MQPLNAINAVVLHTSEQRSRLFHYSFRNVAVIRDGYFAKTSNPSTNWPLANAAMCLKNYWHSVLLVDPIDIVQISI